MTKWQKTRLVEALIVLHDEGLVSWHKLAVYLELGSVTTIWNWRKGTHLPSPVFCRKAQEVLRLYGRTHLAAEAMTPV
jgi:hypothetical protein